MPKVPSYQPKIQQVGVPNARLSAVPNADTYDASIAEAAQNAGSVVQRIHLEEVERANQVANLQTSNLLSEAERKYTQAGLATSGKDSFGIPDRIASDYDKETGELEKTLANPVQREYFRNEREHRRRNLYGRLVSHSLRETQEYDRQQFGAAVNNLKLEAVDNPTLSGEKTAELRRRIQEYAGRNGMPKEWVDLETSKEVSATHSAVIASLSASGDVNGARQYYAQARGELIGNDRIQADNTVKVITTRAKAQEIGDQILLKIQSDDVKTITDAREMAKSLAGDDPELREEAIRQATIEFNSAQAAKKDMADRRFSQADEQFREASRISDIDPGVWSQLSTREQTTFRALELQSITNTRPADNSDRFYTLKLLAATNPKQFASEDMRRYRADVSDHDYSELIKLQADVLKGDGKLAQGITTQAEVTKRLMAQLNIEMDDKETDPRALSFFGHLNQAVIANQKMTGREATPDEVEAIGKKLLADVVVTKQRHWALNVLKDALPFGFLEDGQYSETHRLFEAPAPVTERAKLIEALQDAGITEPTDEHINALWRARMIGRTNAQ